MLSFFFIIVLLREIFILQELKILIKITLIISNILPKNIQAFFQQFQNQRFKTFEEFINSNIRNVLK